MTDVVLNYPDTIELGERVENVCSEALTFLTARELARSGPKRGIVVGEGTRWTL